MDAVVVCRMVTFVYVCIVERVKPVVRRIRKSSLASVPQWHNQLIMNKRTAKLVVIMARRT